MMLSFHSKFDCCPLLPAFFYLSDTFVCTLKCIEPFSESMVMFSSFSVMHCFPFYFVLLTSLFPDPSLPALACLLPVRFTASRPPCLIVLASVMYLVSVRPFPLPVCLSPLSQAIWHYFLNFSLSLFHDPN